MADAALVVEAIVENLDAKRKLFADLEAIVGDDCILATNTSSISVTAIAAQLRRPERLVGMHFFNPVPLMALVEVISGLATEQRRRRHRVRHRRRMGQEPGAREVDARLHRQPRRPSVLRRRRCACCPSRRADAATLDAVMRECGGFRMGPFELMDLIGHDVNFSVTQSVHPRLLRRPALHAIGAAAGNGQRRLPRPQIGPRLLPLRRRRGEAGAQTEAAAARPESVGVSVEPGVNGAVTAPMEQRLQGAGFTVAAPQAAAGRRRSTKRRPSTATAPPCS